jgi:hypothetical protein
VRALHRVSSPTPQKRGPFMAQSALSHDPWRSPDPGGSNQLSCFDVWSKNKNRESLSAVTAQLSREHP